MKRKANKNIETPPLSRQSNKRTRSSLQNKENKHAKEKNKRPLTCRKPKKVSLFQNKQNGIQNNELNIITKDSSAAGNSNAIQDIEKEYLRQKDQTSLNKKTDNCELNNNLANKIDNNQDQERHLPKVNSERKVGITKNKPDYTIANDQSISPIVNKATSLQKEESIYLNSIKSPILGLKHKILKRRKPINSNNVDWPAKKQRIYKSPVAAKLNESIDMVTDDNNVDLPTKPTAMSSPTNCSKNDDQDFITINENVLNESIDKTPEQLVDYAANMKCSTTANSSSSKNKDNKNAVTKDHEKIDKKEVPHSSTGETVNTPIFHINVNEKEKCFNENLPIADNQGIKTTLLNNENACEKQLTQNEKLKSHTMSNNYSSNSAALCQKTKIKLNVRDTPKMSINTQDIVKRNGIIRDTKDSTTQFALNLNFLNNVDRTFENSFSGNESPNFRISLTKDLTKPKDKDGKQSINISERIFRGLCNINKTPPATHFKQTSSVNSTPSSVININTCKSCSGSIFNIIKDSQHNKCMCKTNWQYQEQKNKGANRKTLFNNMNTCVFQSPQLTFNRDGTDMKTKFCSNKSSCYRTQNNSRDNMHVSHIRTNYFSDAIATQESLKIRSQRYKPPSTYNTCFTSNIACNLENMNTKSKLFSPRCKTGSSLTRQSLCNGGCKCNLGFKSRNAKASPFSKKQCDNFENNFSFNIRACKTEIKPLAARLFFFEDEYLIGFLSLKFDKMKLENANLYQSSLPSNFNLKTNNTSLLKAKSKSIIHPSKLKVK